MKAKILGKQFFDRDPVSICKDLLGNFLVINNKKYLITEVEAYDGQDDEACHARHGKTERNVPMFGNPGCWYVYMVYGMYYMLNIVTGPGKHPSAVLLRGLSAVRTIHGNNLMLSNKQLNGPGKLTKYLGIDKRFNGKKADKKTGLRIEESGIVVRKITTAPRIGIEYASPKWRDRHWRFFI